MKGEIFLKVVMDHKQFMKWKYNDKSLASIPETAREAFMELALLDVKMNLYPTMKQYSTISTSLGNIDLKIDDWGNAESERKDLINRYDDTYHLDFRPMYYI